MINDFIPYINFPIVSSSFFFGLVFGWFCRKGKIGWMLIGFLAIGQFIEHLIVADYKIATLSFILGFLIHTWKPLYRKMTT